MMRPGTAALALPALLLLAAPPGIVTTSNSNNSIGSFGWYWAMEDGSADGAARNERNCSAGPCSWDHAGTDFVQNSWKSPLPGNATDWDVSDILQLAGKGVRSVVSVSHLFTSGPAGGLLPDHAARWARYLARLGAAGALPHVAYWYPSDEPDLRMPAATLNTILAAIRARSDTPVLLTLSNLAMNQTTGGLNYALDPAQLQPADVLTFDIYSGGSVPWGAMEAKLHVLSAFVSTHGIRMAVIPDATSGTFAALGAAGNNVLNDQFYRYCAARPACVGLFPFIGGTWQDIAARPLVLQSFNEAADAAKSGDWTQTAVDPPVVCDAGELYHMPCSPGPAAAAAAGRGKAARKQCDAIASGVFGYDTGNRSAPQDILPDRSVSMMPGQVWEYREVCRKILGVPGTPACDGGTVACWQGITTCGWKSKVVSCSGADHRRYTDVCSAHLPGSSTVDLGWTCCVRIA